MGKQENMKFVGTVDNLIYYQWKDVYAVRTKPATVQQTNATIQQSKLFGVACHTGAVLRSLLKPALPNAKDRNMMRRFEQAIVQWLRSKAESSGVLQNNLPFITGFEFNENSLLKHVLKPLIVVQAHLPNMISVLMPPLNPVKDIVVPAFTKHISCICRAAVCNLDNDITISSTSTKFIIDYNDIELPAHEIELPLTVTEGSLAIVLLAFEYTVVKNGVAQVLKDERWLPAGVVGSMYY